MKLDRRIQEIGVYGISAILRQAVGFLLLPVYTRYLTPQDYGIIGLLSVTVFFFELIFGARFANAVFRYYGDEDINNKESVISTALISTIILSSVGVFVIGYNSDYLGDLVFREEGYSGYIKIYSVMLLATGIEYYGLMYLRILNKASSFFYISFTKLILQVGLNVYLIVVMKIGVMGFILSAVISTCLYAIGLTYYMFKKCGLGFDLHLFKMMFMYSFPLWLAGSVALFNNMGNRYFINIFSGLSDVGLFELGYKFASLILVLFWGPFNNWWQVERYKIFRSKEFGDNFQDVFYLVVVALSVLCVGSVYFSWSVIDVMASDEFEGAALGVAPLSFAVAAFCLAQFLEFNFLVSDRTNLLFIYKVFTGIVLVLLYFIIVPNYGFVGAGVSMALANIAIVILMYLHGRKIIDLNIKLIAGLVPLIYSLVFTFFWYALYVYYKDKFVMLLMFDVALYGLFLALIYWHSRKVILPFAKKLLWSSEP